MERQVDLVLQVRVRGLEPVEAVPLQEGGHCQALAGPRGVDLLLEGERKEGERREALRNREQWDRGQRDSGTRSTLTSVMPVPDTVLSEGHRLPSCMGKEKRGQGESDGRAVKLLLQTARARCHLEKTLPPSCS